ncbi:hypothetical protein V9T40_000483 [Parthenolecanium corni]|uniref:Cytochrome P450 n=1 Tax=Parthenolecanium corni TaxID=536013 RepID=A0AAN9Y0I3_9HEMI
MNEFFKEYGPVFRTWIGPKAIVHVGSAEYAQKILSSMVNIEKSLAHEMIKPWLGNSIGVMRGKEWHERRKLLDPAFHFAVLNNFIGIIEKNSQIFNERLENEINSDEFDLYPYVIDCTVDTIAETSMSVQLNIQKGSCKTYVKNIHKVSLLIIRRFMNPLIHWDFIYFLTKDYSILKKATTELHKISSQIVEQRIAQRKKECIETSSNEREAGTNEDNFGRKKHTTYLDILLNNYDKGEGNLTLQNIREEVDSAVFGGYDTVSIGIALTIFLVGHHPEIQKRIRAEVDTVIPSEASSLNAQSISQLKYIEWAFLESLRLYPPAPLVIRCLKESVTLGDCTIPAGTNVMIHFNPIHRSPENFANPNKFDPLNFSPDRIRSMHPYAFVPFSAGPRNCIGQRFAKLEAKIALAMFFKKYEVTSITNLDNLKLIAGIVIVPQHGIKIVKQRIKQRQEQRTKTPPREGKSGKIEEDIGGKQHTTFLDTLLNTYERGEGDLTPEIIREEVDNAMFAGYDTVAIALGMTIYLVGNHPEIQKKIQAELDSVILSDDDFLNSQTLAKLKYLEWVILEGLRLYPPAPMIVRCLKEPVTLDDYTLPAGTDVAIHFNPIHRSPENYPNPDNFDPLNFSTDRENSLNPYAFLTFSGGPRNCIGQKFAKLEEKIMLAMFFKKYEVTSMTKMKDIKLTTKVTIQPPNGLRVKIKCRT